MSMLLLAGCGNSIDVTNLQEGDVVFIESQSSQSPYIKVGTESEEADEEKAYLNGTDGGCPSRSV